jgi:hypothetical protein
MDDHAKDAFLDSLEQAGEAAVQRNLSRSAYSGEHHALALQWIEAREDGRAAVARDSLNVARSARLAAWIAAIFGIIGAVLGAAGLLVALNP